jgi:hypothetical protein
MIKSNCNSIQNESFALTIASMVCLGFCWQQPSHTSRVVAFLRIVIDKSNRLFDAAIVCFAQGENRLTFGHAKFDYLPRHGSLMGAVGEGFSGGRMSTSVLACARARVTIAVNL